MRALIVVDVQNDFCPGGALAVKEGDQVVPVINDLMARFDCVVASKDWHPPDTIHFQKWPVHCVQNTPGAEFHPGLDQSKIGKVFLKGTADRDDGYSAFEATSDNLEDYLRKKGVNELYVCGLATDYCVRATAIDAARAGFKVYVIEDACRGVDAKKGDVRKALDEMKHARIRVIKVQDILK